MSSVSYVNSKAEVLKKMQALAMNINCAKGLQEVMRTNLGPKGTMKMLVGGAGQIKLTKDGSVLLHEMQIQNPTAGMIARSATAQDDIVGDGTTSNVLLVGELMKQAESLIQEGVHPRVITEGYELARKESLVFLDKFKISPQKIDRPLLLNAARTSLGTKLATELANQMVDICVDSVNLIRTEDQPIDLFMIEIMHMTQKLSSETRLVKGLVLDHGGRHMNMPKKLNKCFILTCNVSLEYEKTEVNAQFFYSSAAEREKLMISERKFTDERCKQIIDFKKSVCKNGEGFVIINQKGIDQVCLDALAKENILGLRRAKRRNMERLVLACGGTAINALEGLSEKDLGYADTVYEETLGEEKYTFVEGVKNPKSCTILIKGPNEHTIAMIKDACRDGLRAVKNVIDDKGYIPGGGSFEIACYNHLINDFQKTVTGKPQLGVEAFAKSLLIIPKVLAENSGYDMQDSILKLLDESKKTKSPIGLNIQELGVIDPIAQGIFDNYISKKTWLNVAPTLAQQLLLIDEVMRAGKGLGKTSGEGPEM